MAYRIRVQAYVTPEMLAGGSSPSASGHVKRSCVVAFVPSQNKIIMGSADGDQATLTMGKTKNVFDNFIFTPPEATGGKVADSFRTVAACLKFIPEGDYGTRSGVIGTAYLAGANWGTIGSNTATATNILNTMTKVRTLVSLHAILRRAGFRLQLTRTYQTHPTWPHRNKLLCRRQPINKEQ
jgi:hypothetical protein